MRGLEHLDRLMSAKIEEMLRVAVSEMPDNTRMKEFNTIMTETRSIIELAGFDTRREKTLLDPLD